MFYQFFFFVLYDFLQLLIFIEIINSFYEFFFSGLTALSTYFLTKEIYSEGAGLFAACFIAIGNGAFNFLCVLNSKDFLNFFGYYMQHVIIFFH